MTRRRRRRRRNRRARRRAPWLAIALAAVMLLGAIVLTLDAATRRMGLLDRLAGWFAVRSAGRSAQAAALESPVVIALGVGAIALTLVAAWRLVRQ